jgi:octaprenyl-diphosphate synthase
MIRLDTIKKPVQPHIKAFEKEFRAAIKSNVSLLDTIMRYLVKRKGKQMRPLFVFLTAGMFSNINKSTYHAATLIELLHTATLVHDDVVDDSNMRRGFFSINALWKNKIAVLVGDYLLSRGLLHALENNEFELLRIVSEATKEMSEGELLQIEKARRLDIEETVYFEIIRKKTASLIASCCASGASSAGQNEETVKKMHRFGELTGIAFQIKDDLFDYSKSMETGKPNGLDIKEQKMTLPLIYTLNNVPASEKKQLIRIVKRHNTNKEKVAQLIKRVHECGGIDYARNKMNEYRKNAIDCLSGFPDSPEKSSLIDLVNFTVERKK